MDNHKTLNDVYLEYRSESPERILEHIQDYFIKMGKLYRRGRLSEEGFYLATYYGYATDDTNQLYILLWELKHNIRVDRSRLWSNTEFQNAWHEWKSSGSVQAKPWIDYCISYYGKPEDAARWLFAVIDACKIPLAEFEAIMNDSGDELPSLWWRVGYDTTELILANRCIDIQKLLRDPFPEMKEFLLHFEGGLTARLTVNQMTKDQNQERHYSCTGIISDYMEFPGKIQIDFSTKGSMDVCFHSVKSTPWKTLMHTDLNDMVPHSRWSNYNRERTTHYLRREAEYKILRLPYLLGADEKPASANAPERTESIIRIVK